MLRIVLFVATVLLSVLVSLIARRSRSRLPRFLFISGFVFLAAGLLLMLAAGTELEKAFAKKSWPVVTGEIIRSEVTGERAFHPNIVYRYVVDSVTYVDSTDLNQPPFGSKRNRRDVAYTRAHDFYRGEHLAVYYDPANPAVSTLRPVPDWSLYGQTGLGVVLVVLGALFSFGLRHRYGNKETAHLSEG